MLDGAGVAVFLQDDSLLLALLDHVVVEGVDDGTYEQQGEDGWHGDVDAGDGEHGIHHGVAEGEVSEALALDGGVMDDEVDVGEEGGDGDQLARGVHTLAEGEGDEDEGEDGGRGEADGGGRVEEFKAEHVGVAVRHVEDEAVGDEVAVAFALGHHRDGVLMRGCRR